MKKLEDARALKNVLKVGSSIPAAITVLNADSNDLVTLGTVIANAPFTLFVFKRHYV